MRLFQSPFSLNIWGDILSGVDILSVYAKLKFQVLYCLIFAEVKCNVRIGMLLSCLSDQEVQV